MNSNQKIAMFLLLGAINVDMMTNVKSKIYMNMFIRELRFLFNSLLRIFGKLAIALLVFANL